ncbi:hypothetical protein [Brevibacillus centrosporus]|uniref:Uncharacterized protein n=1 Tax=Brevibacillus centrosporus TaxID=54910 RepID=A0A1I3LY82_9BACL|nr:hypothetical protein [Brevibacillus centrosporus]SFI89627.1 hypothetical protein SAMN05518846_101461 [Brevibacillus centrosporus]
MADLIGQSQFKDRIRGVVQGDDATPELWNVPYQDLISNDVFLNTTKLDKTEVAANGANKVPRLDATGKGAFSITGDAASIGGKVPADFVPQTDVAANGANKVPRLDATGKGAFSITGDAASIGGKVPADFVPQTDVAANGANKVPRLDATGKGVFSITGDAATVAGKTVGNASANVPLSNGTVNTNLNADMVDGYHVGSGANQIPTRDANAILSADILTMFNQYASGKDANGIYTVVDFKRADGTLFMKSTLTNPDANGKYQTNTWQFYNAAGTAVVNTKTWTITYDADGNAVSKVVA